jgi:rhodanese-related sulfurtransferase
MKTERRSNKKSILVAAAMIVVGGAMMGCNEGYVHDQNNPEALALRYYLPPENLLEIVETPDPGIRLIDVRPSNAYFQWHIPTSENYPSSQIADIIDANPNELPVDLCYIVMCETGPRAQAVIENVLEPRGYDCLMNYGASIRWPYGFVTNTDQPGTLDDV